MKLGFLAARLPRRGLQGIAVWTAREGFEAGPQVA
ncbi:MAG: hypothetical protein JWQ37_1600 [Blastococcus sp.]|jgi:hypothetical protein|nr:hypothetical protein [Blastococcus sp.]